MFVVIGLISASLSWFGLSDMVDRHVYNLFNQILGPAYGKTSSDAEALAERALRHVDPSPPLGDSDPAGQRLITVVTVIDNDLKESGEAWPASYGFHAEILEGIAELGPELIFVDVHFGALHRQDPTLPVLSSTLEAISEGAFVEEEEEEQEEDAQPTSHPPPIVLLAGDPESCDGGIIPELLANSGAHVASAPRASDREDQHDRRYPLSSNLGTGPGCRVRSAAASAYQHMSIRNRDDDSTLPAPPPFDRAAYTDTMAVVWGTNTSPINSQTRDCLLEPHTETWVRVIDRAANRLLGNPSSFKLRCPYHTTLSAGLFRSDSFREDLEPLIRGRYVFYGIDRRYSYDHVVPPTHLSLPGVHLHAMALDNLITFGSEYVRVADERPAREWAMLVFVLGILGLARGISLDYTPRCSNAGGTKEKCPLPRWRVHALVALACLLAVPAAIFASPLLVNRPPSEVVWTGAGLGIALGAVAATLAGIAMAKKKHPPGRWLPQTLFTLMVMAMGAILVALAAGFFFHFFSIAPVSVAGVVTAAFASATQGYATLEDVVISYLSGSQPEEAAQPTGPRDETLDTGPPDDPLRTTP